eukprot:4125127-Prymnesium_polylepis.2
MPHAFQSAPNTLISSRHAPAQRSQATRGRAPSRGGALDPERGVGVSAGRVAQRQRGLRVRPLGPHPPKEGGRVGKHALQQYSSHTDYIVYGQGSEGCTPCKQGEREVRARE